MISFLRSLFPVARPGKPEVRVMYFGRASEFLMMTSERLVIPDEPCTLGKVLGNLRSRGDRWAYELDDSHILCAVNGKAAMLSDVIENGAEISFSSRKSLYAI